MLQFLYDSVITVVLCTIASYVRIQTSMVHELILIVGMLRMITSRALLIYA